MLEHLLMQTGPKLVIGFLLMLLYLHLHGRGALAPISTLGQVGNVVFGAIIGGSIYNPSISVTELVFVAGIWATLILLVRYYSHINSKVKDIIDGSSIRLVKDGKLLSKNLSNSGLSIRDFIMLIRSHGVNGINDIANAWFEYNGQITIMKKGEHSMSTPLMENGVINKTNLQRLGKDVDWITTEAAKQGIKMPDVYYAEFYEGEIWFYPYIDK